MHHFKLLLLPLLAGGLSFSVQAADCRPDNTNTTIAAKSKKFYCTESLDSSGCNAGRTSLRLEIDSSCKKDAEVDVTCTVLFDMKTRKFYEGTQRSVSATERFELENGYAKEKMYMTLNSLVDPILKIEVADVTCRIAEAEMPAMNPHPELKREEMPEATPAAAPTPPLEPKAQPQTKEIVITPAPKPDTAAEDAREREKRLLELEILKEENRARELELKAMELKIKLKEMER